MPENDLPDIQQELGQLGQEKLFGFSCTQTSVTFEVFSGGGTDKESFDLIVQGDWTRRLTLVRTKIEKREASTSTHITYQISEIVPPLTLGLFSVSNPFTAAKRDR